MIIKKKLIEILKKYKKLKTKKLYAIIKRIKDFKNDIND